MTNLNLWMPLAPRHRPIKRKQRNLANIGGNWNYYYLLNLNDPSFVFSMCHLASISCCEEDRTFLVWTVHFFCEHTVRAHCIARVRFYFYQWRDESQTYKHRTSEDYSKELPRTSPKINNLRLQFLLISRK